MHVSVISHREPEALDLAAFERLARFVLEREEVNPGVELSVAVVELAEMTGLNERYRGKEGPTDVLSFPCDDPCPVAEADEPITLGDVIVSPEIAEENAIRLGHTVEDELNLLLVHGILHLLGYDHEADEDALAMQERERVLLEAYERTL